MSAPDPRVAAECHEEVTRQGELQPCDKTAVALKLDEEGRPYSVCAFHARGAMVPLVDLARALSVGAE